MKGLPEHTVAIAYDHNNADHAALAEALAAHSPLFRTVDEEEPTDGFKAVIAFDREHLEEFEPLDIPAYWFLPYYDTPERPEDIHGVEGVICASHKLAHWVRQRAGEVPVIELDMPAHPAFASKSERSRVRRALRVNRGALAVFCREENMRLAAAMEGIESDPRFHLVTLENVALLGMGTETERLAFAMSACDVIVAEPKTPRCAEAIAAGTPLIGFTAANCECFFNAVHLAEVGAARIARDETDLLYHLGNLHEVHENLARHAEAISRLRREKAMAAFLKKLHRDCEISQVA